MHQIKCLCYKYIHLGPQVLVYPLEYLVKTIVAKYRIGLLWIKEQAAEDQVQQLLELLMQRPGLDGSVTGAFTGFKDRAVVGMVLAVALVSIRAGGNRGGRYCYRGVL